MTDITVTDNAARRRYEITIDGKRAMLAYTRAPGSIALTRVPRVTLPTSSRPV